jgi:uncharacterized protein (UPF0248 family)
MWKICGKTMITIKDLLNKIKWDNREDPRNYEFFYKDRFLIELQRIKCDDIINVEDGFMFIKSVRTVKFGGKTSREEHILPIPLHRIKQVTKKKVVIWERNH